VDTAGTAMAGLAVRSLSRPGPRTARPAARKCALAVSRRTPVCRSMRRSDQPSRANATICCCLSC